MKHPLEFIPQNLRKTLFFVFLAFTLIIFGVFRVLDQPLRTSSAPNGIVSFELARTTNASQAMVNSWDDNARLFAAFGLGMDYLFMPVYALALSFGLLLAGSGKAKWLQVLTTWLGWGAILAALFDAVENYALWHILIGTVHSSFPQVAAICATIKFILLLLGLAGAILGWVVRK
ncbi:MAG: hypothetical protein U0Z26_05430 [Anaerolineales bacterium]